VLALAKECTNLEIYTQVSTAYVNCNRLGYIEEKLYNPTQDVDSLVKEYMAMSDLDMKEQ
jgi:fatty acyl-CoA reductase